MDLHGYLGVMCFCDENDSLAKLCVTTDSFLRPTFLTFDELLTLEGDQQTHYRSARGFSLCPPRKHFNIWKRRIRNHSC